VELWAQLQIPAAALTAAPALYEHAGFAGFIAAHTAAATISTADLVPIPGPVPQHDFFQHKLLGLLKHNRGRLPHWHGCLPIGYILRGLRSYPELSTATLPQLVRFVLTETQGVTPICQLLFQQLPGDVTAYAVVRATPGVGRPPDFL
jgi:hypothetical protein